MTKKSGTGKSSRTVGNNNACGECDTCCKYVSVEIDKPVTKTEVEDIKYYLYHRDVSVYIDHDNGWYILFVSRCDKLGPDGMCTIYEERPPICRNFNREDCHEEDLQESHKVWFQDVNSFMRYIRRVRPAFYKKYYSSHTKCQSGLRA